MLFREAKKVCRQQKISIYTYHRRKTYTIWLNELREMIFFLIFA